MHPTAALMLANAYIGDLFAEAERERLAEQVRRTTRPSTAGRAAVDRLRVNLRRFLRAIRALPRATAG